MKVDSKKLFFVALAVGCLAAPAEAGEPQILRFDCHTFSDGSGWCDGSLAGAREDVYPGDRASFGDSVPEGSEKHFRMFSATYKDNSWACQVPPDGNPALIELWSSALTSRGYFSITWDASGECTSLYLASASNWYY